MILKILITSIIACCLSSVLLKIVNAYRARTFSLFFTYIGTLLCILSINAGGIKNGDYAIAVISSERSIWIGIGLIMSGFYIDLHVHWNNDEK